jgi:hypothetical protein
MVRGGGSLKELSDSFINAIRKVPNTLSADSRQRIKACLYAELQKIYGEIAQEKFNHHLTYYRLRSHFGGSVVCLHNYLHGYEWSPMTSLSAFACHNSIPYHARYNRHTSTVNVDLAHAVFPELSDIPFTSGGVGQVKYQRFGASAEDVTDLYKNKDLTDFYNARKHYTAALESRAKTPFSPEREEAFIKFTDTSNLLKQTLSLFDSLREYDDEMGKIFTPELKEHIKNRGIKNNVNDWFMRVTMIADIISVCKSSAVSHKTIGFADDVPRLDRIDLSVLENTDSYDPDRIISENGISFQGGGYADLSSNDARVACWTGSMSDGDKIAFFSMEWLNPFLDRYEKTKSYKYWLFCENILSGYWIYLIWGGMTFFEERQLLPFDTSLAYAKRLIIMTRMLKLSPDCWYFAGSVLRIVRQHAEYLIKDDDRKSPAFNTALICASAVLKTEKYMPEVKEEAEKRASGLAGSLWLRVLRKISRR